MDAARMNEIEEQLVAWGVLERGATLAPTRRFRGAMARVAAELAGLEKKGDRPAGNPVQEVVTRALAQVPLPHGATMDRDHERFVVAVQLASLPEAVRASLGL